MSSSGAIFKWLSGPTKVLIRPSRKYASFGFALRRSLQGTPSVPLESGEKDEGKDNAPHHRRPMHRVLLPLINDLLLRRRLGLSIRTAKVLQRCAELGREESFGIRVDAVADDDGLRE